mmetsp:Transcript_65494/g.136441  ORF Transcript_65494/g.136441 Transcript_65494/m.136441 type:complete len:130 (-) Transcript_65494:256-645(-)|eukprot:CAMPEP_0181334374 /NCGR_PEP_ID=MMETSP1101-20121128/26216_1 /TAXON_ID=46948 /ORGANISM="Rhodomonas abbreviata, Strain Caron Lab Isolate" /LENGTH=129 /DNA_ID=CAMNT_0023444327 /DNA_START=175 /DNA_END=564 /DNA_ORIENTATION=+
MVGPKVIVALALFSTLAIVLSILSCVINTDKSIPANWTPMFVVATYAVAPFPIVILGKSQEGSQLAYWAYFTTGWLLAVSFGIPIILAHSSQIAIGNCFLSLASSSTFYGTVAGLSWWQARSSGDIYGF